MIDHYCVEKKKKKDKRQKKKEEKKSRKEKATINVNCQRLNHYWGGPIARAKSSITLAKDIKSSASWEATQAF